MLAKQLKYANNTNYGALLIAPVNLHFAAGLLVRVSKTEMSLYFFRFLLVAVISWIELLRLGEERPFQL